MRAVNLHRRLIYFNDRKIRHFFEFQLFFENFPKTFKIANISNKVEISERKALWDCVRGVVMKCLPP